MAVTGAGRGIGRAIAQELESAGACLVLSYCHSKEQAEALAAQLECDGAQAALVVHADESACTQATTLIEQAIKRFDRIDVLVSTPGSMSTAR